jgi:hypothetical protein
LAHGAPLENPKAHGGLLTLLHEGPLPAPEARAGEATGQWVMTHGLALRCPCSRRIVDYLVKRGATPTADERVLLVDATDEAQQRLLAAGFTVTSVSSEALTGMGFVAVPGLVIRRPDGSVAYAGAHAPKRSGPIDDLAILQAANGTAPIKPFAVLGCALSRALSDQTDPLALKTP